MSSIDSLLSWLDEAVTDAELALQNERVGFLRLASPIDEAGAPTPPAKRS